jgi:hypothetical protein
MSILSSILKPLDPFGILTGEDDRQNAMDEYQNTMSGISGEYTQAAEAAAKALEALSQGLDPSQLTPYQFSVLQEYHPEIAQQVAEKAPQLMNQGGVGRDLMMEQAQNARSMYSEGDSPASRAARELQMMDSSKLQQQLLSQLQAKTSQEGHGNANTDLMMALGVGQQAQDAMYKSQLQSQANGDNNRLQALQMMGSAGANIQNNDQQAQRSNVDIMNSYNERLARNKWDYNKYQADTQNNANKYNIDQRQGAADNNVLARNKAVTDTRNQKNDLAIAAIKARQEGANQSTTSRGTAANGRAGFDAGSSSRRLGDLASGISIVDKLSDIFTK